MDYAKQARINAEAANRTARHDTEAIVFALTSQTYTTLALAEQQHIVNLIKLDPTNPELRKALGLW